MTATTERRADQRWLLLVPPTATIVETDHPGLARAELAEMPSGTPVAVVGGSGSRRFARRHGVRVERVYVAVPGLDEPVVVAEVAEPALRWFAATMLTVPSGRVRWHGPMWTAVQVARRWPRLLAHAPVGDRIVIGVRR